MSDEGKRNAGFPNEETRHDGLPGYRRDPSSHEPRDSRLEDLREDKELQFDNLPNRLTLFRMACTPLIIYLLWQRQFGTDVAAALVFAAAAITDFIDGYIARRQQLVTIYGKLLDPLADKFIVVASLILLQHLDRLHPLVVIIVVLREMAILGLRALASAEGVIIAASTSAQWKTATQMVGIPLMMAPEFLAPIYGFQIGQGLLYFSVVMNVWTGKDYAVAFFRGVAERRRLLREKRKANQNHKSAKRLRFRRKKNVDE